MKSWIVSKRNCWFVNLLRLIVYL